MIVDDLQSAREYSANRLDQVVDQVRERFPAVGQYMAAEYELTRDQAAMYAAGGYEGDVPPCVASWVEATGMSAQAAADNILATAAAFEAVLEQTRYIRLVGKADIRSAETVVEVEQKYAYWVGLADQFQE